MAFYTYIGFKDYENYWKRLIVRYHGDRWLFLKQITVKIDEQTYNINVSDLKSDNNLDVWEWIDVPVKSHEDVIIQSAILSKDKVKVRFTGSRYHQDWILSAKEIKGLKEIEDLYYLLESYNLLDDLVK